MRNNLREMDLFRARYGSTDMNGKQKMTCSSKTSTSVSSMAEQGRTSNGTDTTPKSSNAAIDRTRPFGEKPSLKRTISKIIEQEISLRNEEFPEILSVAVSENLFLKPDRCLFFRTCIS